MSCEKMKVAHLLLVLQLPVVTVTSLRRINRCRIF